MKQKNNPYLLTICLMITALLFTFLGYYWNSMYDTSMKFDMDIPPLTKAMQGIHDELYLPPSATQASINIDTLIVNSGDESSISGQINEFMQKCINFQNDIAKRTKKADTLEFSTVTDEYFDDACFIGDSRTVGISQYSGIKNATFLCKTSLSIYDFDKPKITYESKKTSIQQVLSDKKFAKIYLMVSNPRGEYYFSFRVYVYLLYLCAPERAVAHVASQLQDSWHPVSVIFQCHAPVLCI